METLFEVLLLTAVSVAGFVHFTKTHLGGSEPEGAPGAGFGGQRMVEREHVLVRLDFPAKALVPHMSAHTTWAVGSGPVFSVPSTSKGYRGTVVEFRDLALDSQFPCSVFPDAGAWQVRGALTAEVRQTLFALPDAHLSGDGRRLELRWRGDGRDREEVERVVEQLARLASFGLAPLHAAATLPDAEVCWPSGLLHRRTSPDARFHRAWGAARLHFAHHRWRLTGPVPSHWPEFDMELHGGTPVEGGLDALPPELLPALRAMQSVTLSARGEELELAFEGLPDVPALEAGLRAFQLAARPPSEGAFR